MKIILDTTSDIKFGPWDHDKLLNFLTKLSHLIPKNLDLTINHVDDETMSDINLRFRGINKSTNILSFNYGVSESKITGELILDIDIIIAEAETLCITLSQHYAHLIIHGILHLNGYDHEVEHEAILMEAKETQWLTTLGFDPAYSSS